MIAWLHLCKNILAQPLQRCQKKKYATSTANADTCLLYFEISCFLCKTCESFSLSRHEWSIHYIFRLARRLRFQLRVSSVLSPLGLLCSMSHSSRCCHELREILFFEASSLPKIALLSSTSVCPVCTFYWLFVVYDCFTQVTMFEPVFVRHSKNVSAGSKIQHTLSVILF